MALQAYQLFRRALELSPGNAWSHYGFSYLLTVLHRFDEARLHLEEARALDPLRVDYTMTLAELYLWTGDPERAFFSSKASLTTLSSFVRRCCRGDG